MQKIRCFIAINLPKNIKQELFKIQSFWSEIPAKWTKIENLHITLTFLGTIDKENLFKIENIIQQSVSNFSSFEINISETLYMPQFSKVPTMIWAKGDQSEHFTKLKKYIDKAIESEKKIKIEKNKSFTPHITLARIKKWNFKQQNKEDLPIVNKEFFLKFQVRSIELMESRLGKGGPKYNIIKSFPLHRKKDF